jgi:hypothetical protein
MEGMANCMILLRVCVTINGVWIGNWIYWTPTNRNYTLKFTTARTKSNQPASNGFQRRIFLSFRVHVLTGWRLSHNFLIKVKVTLPLAVYRQSVRLGASPLEAHDQRFSFQPNSCGNSPYVTSSLMRRWVYLLWICLALCKVYISHI